MNTLQGKVVWFTLPDIPYQEYHWVTPHQIQFEEELADQAYSALDSMTAEEIDRLSQRWDAYNESQEVPEDYTF